MDIFVPFRWGKQGGKAAFWRLPHDLRRGLYRAVFSGHFEELARLRQEEPEDTEEATLLPFIRNKCIFVHIPKAAGISIGYSLFGRRTGNHLSVQEYRLIFSQKEFEEYFKFTFVRNPWDRLLSAFMFLKEGGICPADRQWAEEHLAPYEDFTDFVLGWVNRRNILKRRHFWPQYAFLCSRRHQLDVDFVGKLENIEHDYDLVREKVGIGKPLGRKNQTQSKQGSFRDYYTGETAAVVAEVFREDIDMFGYQFSHDETAAA